MFDVPAVSESTAAAAVRRTIAAFPVLQRIYDDAFVSRLAKRRVQKNILLLRLMQPDDDIAMSFWSSVVSDFEDIGIEAAIKAFAPKMHDPNREKIESWRTELWFAAWLARYGVAIELEPAVGSGHAEFRASTAPVTWWEIKTPLEAREPRADDAVQLDLQKRLHDIPEPFRLFLLAFDLDLADVPPAVKDLRRQLASFAKTEASLPCSFTSNGLVVEAFERTNGRGGFAGALGKGYLFRGEHAKLAASHIRDAARQLPADGAGIVVVDCSNATWLHEQDVEDACFGDGRVTYREGSLIECRLGGVLRPGYGTRISAVVAYNRTIVRHGRNYDILMLHNPYARIPLPPTAFDYPDIRHGRIVPQGAGAVYQVSELPKDAE
jgi:hypothetical protein